MPVPKGGGYGHEATPDVRAPFVVVRISAAPRRLTSPCGNPPDSPPSGNAKV
jgi:hypothetical protein